MTFEKGMTFDPTQDSQSKGGTASRSLCSTALVDCDGGSIYARPTAANTITMYSSGFTALTANDLIAGRGIRHSAYAKVPSFNIPMTLVIGENDGYFKWTADITATVSLHEVISGVPSIYPVPDFPPMTIGGGYRRFLGDDGSGSEDVGETTGNGGAIYYVESYQHDFSGTVKGNAFGWESVVLECSLEIIPDRYDKICYNPLIGPIPPRNPPYRRTTFKADIVQFIVRTKSFEGARECVNPGLIVDSDCYECYYWCFTRGYLNRFNTIPIIEGYNGNITVVMDNTWKDLV